MSTPAETPGADEPAVLDPPPAHVGGAELLQHPVERPVHGRASTVEQADGGKDLRAGANRAGDVGGLGGGAYVGAQGLLAHGS